MPSVLPWLSRHRAVVLREFWPATECARLAERVWAARSEWTADFGGAQWSLGRAFYTHLETGRSREYFADRNASDARVERALPGMQRAVRAALSRLLGGTVVPRAGFCGPGVHVFLPESPVARRGGVVHFDVEGLTPAQLDHGARAVSLVLVLQPAALGGGLRVWPALYRDREIPLGPELRRPSTLLAYAAGDLILIESRRLHQIQSFQGTRARITVTVHAAEIDEGRWETWF